MTPSKKKLADLRTLSQLSQPCGASVYKTVDRWHCIETQIICYKRLLNTEMKTFFGNTMGSKNQIWREKLVLKKWFPNKLQSVTLI